MVEKKKQARNGDIFFEWKVKEKRKIRRKNEKENNFPAYDVIPFPQSNEKYHFTRSSNA